MSCLSSVFLGILTRGSADRTLAVLGEGEWNTSCSWPIPNSEGDVSEKPALSGAEEDLGGGSAEWEGICFSACP